MVGRDMKIYYVRTRRPKQGRGLFKVRDMRSSRYPPSGFQL